jgi:hypothetical protein
MHHKPLSVLNSVRDVPGLYHDLPPPFFSYEHENNNVTSKKP